MGHHKKRHQLQKRGTILGFGQEQKSEVAKHDFGGRTDILFFFQVTIIIPLITKLDILMNIIIFRTTASIVNDLELAHFFMVTLKHQVLPLLIKYMA